MSDERKIISFSTRRPVEDAASEPESAPAEQIDTHVDEDTVGVAERLLELAKSGDYSGALVIAWNREAECFFTDLILPEDDFPENSALKFSGMIDVVKEQLREVIRGSFVVDQVQ
ncbi:hypothetical protein [Mesorhizobium sp.]|uniref:hypothetical protein n=1 Tax=Mesorhizobium sp. TaxID=1871066 RepID=UPI000FE35E9B|nr:hypothetical protein [Mesorhizobium sp.]RWJ03506.1 MAG: hypothetical protein EOR24_32520 [Mesorhizobium sp.]